MTRPPAERTPSRPPPRSPRAPRSPSQPPPDNRSPSPGNGGGGGGCCGCCGPQAAGLAIGGAVIGGIGHVPGAVVGALALGLVEEFVVGYGKSTWRDAVAFGFLIVVLLFKPEGIFGKVTTEKV